MLKLLTVVSKNGDTQHAGFKVFNTDSISELRTYNTTGARFRFRHKPDRQSGGEDTYEVSESRATVLTAINQTFNAIGLTLNVHPDNSAANTVVATAFNAKDIVFIYSNTVSTVALSWIVVNENGYRHRRYLVAHKLADIPDLARTGTTTTTSTTTSTTSTTSSTTSTSTTSTSTTSTTS